MHQNLLVIVPVDGRHMGTLFSTTIEDELDFCKTILNMLTLFKLTDSIPLVLLALAALI